MNKLDFPLSFKKNNKYKELEKLVEDITSHESMLIKEKHILENMIRASLLFTICFWGNTLSLLHLALGDLRKRSPFHVKKDTKFIHLLLDLASSELATKNISTKHDTYSPHFVPMLEAAQDAGVDTMKIEDFISKINNNLKSLCQELGFSKSVTDYLLYSEKCTKKFESSFATIALRELTLSFNFKVILDNLPKENKYKKYKEFLSKHIDIDQSEHSILMKEALEQYGNVDELIDVMIKFYNLRKNVYDECLLRNLY